MKATLSRGSAAQVLSTFSLRSVLGASLASSRRLLVLTAILIAAGSFTSAQTNPNTDQGLKPYDSFHGGNLDSVRVTSGNLFFHTTEYSAAQRGKAALTFSLQYNNKGFRLQIVCVNGSKGPWQMPVGSAPDPSSGGTGCAAYYTWHWCGTGVQLIVDQNPDQTASCAEPGCPRVDSGEFDYSTGMEIFVTPCTAYTSDGAAHQLADTGSGYRAVDASGIFWQGNPATDGVNWTLDRYGLVNHGSLDTNGNFLSGDSSNNYLDTLNRAVPPIPRPTVFPPPPSTASLSSCPNLNLPYQPLVGAYAWNPPGPTGPSPYVLCYASVYIRSGLFGGSYTFTTYLKDTSVSAIMLQSLVRPDGTAWSFIYDGANPNDTTSVGYGDLLKMIYPTGGSVSYTWGTEYPYIGQYTPGMPTTSSRSVETRTVEPMTAPVLTPGDTAGLTCSSTQ